MAAPVPTVNSDAPELLLRKLDELDLAADAFAPGGPRAALIDACLGVMRALPGCRGLESIPEDFQALSEAAAFFSWDANSQLGQHIFDVDLWDDALAALALAVVEPDDTLVHARSTEAAAAIAASARFVLLPEGRRREALDAVGAATASDAFVAARREAIAVARRPRGARDASGPSLLT